MLSSSKYVKPKKLTLSSLADYMVPEVLILYSKGTRVVGAVMTSVTFDQITGSPQFSFNIQKIEQVERTLNGLLSLLNERQEPIVLALDEFQEITNYPEQNVEGILRSHLQQFSHLRYLFSGSSTNLLSSMFSDGG